MSNETTKPFASECEADRIDLAVLNENRANTYALLARMYRSEVDEAFLEELRRLRFPASTGNEKTDKGYRLIAKALSNLWENTIDDLAVDFAGTFLGGGIDAYSAAYPFESVYTSPKHLLMQEARDEVLCIYRSEGLDKQDAWKEGEDHIALELEFMQEMCNRANAALAEGCDEEAIRLCKVQANFLEQHLNSWVALMTADMRRFAKGDLYRGLSYLTEGFLESEGAFLAELLSENEEPSRTVASDRSE